MLPNALHSTMKLINLTVTCILLCDFLNGLHALCSGYQEFEVCSRGTILSDGGSGEVQRGVSEDL